MRSDARLMRPSRLATHAVLTAGLFVVAVLIVGTYLWLGTIASLVVAALVTVVVHLVARRMSRAQ